MPAPIVQIDYGQMNTIARHFPTLADTIVVQLQAVSDQIDRLKANDWTAEAATFYYRQMDNEVLPGLERLVQTLNETGLVLDEVIRAFQSGEEDGSALLRNQTDVASAETWNLMAVAGVGSRSSPAQGNPPARGTGRIPGAPVNVRAGPGTDTADIGDVNGDVTIFGQTIYPDSNGYHWYQIEYQVGDETRTGWVREDMVEDEELGWNDGNPVQLYDQNGNPLSEEDTQNYVRAFSAQQEMLEEYGIDVQMPVGRPPDGSAPTFRPLTPDDADAMEATLQQVRELEGDGGYGIDLRTAGDLGQTVPWTPEEIGVVHTAVTGVADSAYNRAIELGYDVESPQQVFKDVYICGESGCDEPLIIQRENRPAFSDGSYAWNYEEFYGDNRIGFSHSAFYNDADVLANDPAEDVPFSFNPDFTLSELVSHELNHQILRVGRTDPDYMQTGIYTLQTDHFVTYTDKDGICTTEILAGTEVPLGSRDEGYAYAGRSDNTDNEVETDALTAYTITDSYSIDPGQSLESNLAGIARQEQGQAIMTEALENVYGPPPR